jgi:hypothetical protein
VSLVLAALAGVIVAGAIVAVGARESRVALLGLLVALLAASFLADPLPGVLPIASRLVAALIACRLIAVAVREGDAATGGTRLGWPVDALAAVAAAIIGFGTHGLGAPGGGPAAAQAAGFAVGVLATAPLVSGRDVFRLGIGALLLVLGALLVRVGLAGTPSELEQLVTSGLLVGLGGAVAVIVAGARVAVGGLIVDEAHVPRASSALARSIRIARDARGRPKPIGEPLAPDAAEPRRLRFHRRPGATG